MIVIRSLGPLLVAPPAVYFGKDGIEFSVVSP
jgi:hypothetical protein